MTAAKTRLKNISAQKNSRPRTPISSKKYSQNDFAKNTKPARKTGNREEFISIPKIPPGRLRKSKRLSTESGIVVFPDGVYSALSQGFGEFFRIARVVYMELFSAFFPVGVPSGFCAAKRAHHCHPKPHDSVAEFAALARRNNYRKPRQKHSERTYYLNRLAVVWYVARLRNVSARGGPHSRQGY